jgi:hypothetical protein
MKNKYITQDIVNELVADDAAGTREISRAIALAYPYPIRHGTHAPYSGYDVAGALNCFVHKAAANRAPAWMRFPTAGDVQECFVLLGWDEAPAREAALKLCELCDRVSSNEAWDFLMDLLRRTGNMRAHPKALGRR